MGRRKPQRIVMPLTRCVVPALTVLTTASSPMVGAEPQPAERLGRPARTVTVAAVGDWLSESLVNNAAAAVAPLGVRFDHEPLLRPIAPILAQVDLAICHMEVPIDVPGGRFGKVGTGPYRTSLIAAPYEVAGDLRRVGFDRCSTASNHSYDLGAAGIASTLDAFDAAGISHTGTARHPAEAAPDVLTVNGVHLAHLSYARNSNTGFPRELWRLNRAVTAAQVISDVRAARAAGAEIVIVSLHVYIEMLSNPAATDRALVDEITAAAAVDAIVIHGPHTVQGVERVNGTLVHWSLGNLISGMGVAGRNKYADPRTLDGLMATIRFVEQPGGRWTSQEWTVLLCNDPITRIVWPALTVLSQPGLPAALRRTLEACFARSVAVVATLR